MKRIAVLLIAMIGAMSLSAAGNPEADSQFGPRRPGAGMMQEEWEAPELVTLNGTVLIEDDYIIIQADGKEYLVHIPLSDDIAIKSGDSVTVEGYIMPRPLPRLDGILKPVKANVNGTEYVFLGGRRHGGGADCNGQGPRQGKRNRPAM